MVMHCPLPPGVERVAQDARRAGNHNLNARREE
jgi:hypothetical protein